MKDGRTSGRGWWIPLDWARHCRDRKKGGGEGGGGQAYWQGIGEGTDGYHKTGQDTAGTGKRGAGKGGGQADWQGIGEGADGYHKTGQDTAGTEKRGVGVGWGWGGWGGGRRIGRESGTGLMETIGLVKTLQGQVKGGG